MAKRTKTRASIDPAGAQPPPANPFASLAGLRENLPPGEVAEDAATGSALVSGTFASKVVLSHMRKGRGGKTVTVLSGVLLVADARVQFMRELGKALGTNVRGEEDDIVLAGDQRERAKAWLEARGASRVVTSGS